ncbi:hypothetical protein TorRG33x02_355900 [Trema orientale]|uniref:Uncharacterized protein n=1 Tax=Trema orientale TaxID=63057 RepID=A0A2P5A8H7_TREOI|nr:hypothetical protein TorRG33x02_355900 [Trema orientale]
MIQKDNTLRHLGGCCVYWPEIGRQQQLKKALAKAFFAGLSGEGELSILVVGWGPDGLTFGKGEWAGVVIGQEDAGMAGKPLGPDPRCYRSSHRVYLGPAVAGEGMFDESPQPALWTTFSSCYNDDVNVDYIEDELQFKYSSIYNDDLHEEDEEKEDEDEDEDEDEEYEEAIQKIMSEIEHLSCKNLDCKHVDGVERLVRVYADLQRKDKELELLRAELNLAIKELQAIIHKWHTKYLHAKSVLRLNGIPFADP